MAKAKKQSSKKKTGRTETIGFRLEPKLRFAAELAARKQRRSLSSFIEWAVEEATKQVVLESREPSHINEPPFEETAFDTVKTVWDVDEADRFANLAMRYPELLTHDEEVLWKLICKNGCIWRGSFRFNKVRNVHEWTWDTELEYLNYDRLRTYWDTFKAVASGEKSADTLPQWVQEKPLKAGEKADEEDEEEDEEFNIKDDIPF